MSGLCLYLSEDLEFSDSAIWQNYNLICYQFPSPTTSVCFCIFLFPDDWLLSRHSTSKDKNTGTWLQSWPSETREGSFFILSLALPVAVPLQCDLPLAKGVCWSQDSKHCCYCQALWFSESSHPHLTIRGLSWRVSLLGLSLLPRLGGGTRGRDQKTSTDRKPDDTRHPSVWMSHTGFVLFIDFFLPALTQFSFLWFLRASRQKRKSEQA